MGTECGKTDRQRTGGVRSLPVIEVNKDVIAVVSGSSLSTDY
jgi:hypothetical protein